MKKGLMLLILLFILLQKTSGQIFTLLSNNIDSLKGELELNHSPKEKRGIYLSLASSYLHINADSSIVYSEKCIEAGRESEDISLSMRAVGVIVEGLTYQGNLPKALERGLEGIVIETDLSLGKSGKGRIYNGVGEIYFYLNDFEKARYYFTELTKMDKSDISGIGFGHYQLAKIHEVHNDLDSAMYHLDMCYQVFSEMNASDEPYLYDTYPGWYNLRAKIYLKQNRIQEAKNDLYRTLSLTEDSGEAFHNVNTLNDLAELYQSLNKPDSSIYYAQKAINIAIEIDYTRGVLNGSTLLANLYEEVNPEKALWFYKLASRSKEDLYSAGNVQAMKDIISQSERRQEDLKNAEIEYNNSLKQYLLLAVLGFLVVIAIFLFWNNKRKQNANDLLKSQKEEIERQKHLAENALDDLKSTQAQLIQSEKMASLGELTAGIAHEIQNPLNFVNNFSEVSEEMIQEIKEERLKTKDQRDETLEDEILSDIEQNLQKINHHGQRASSIVKGMLEHSRTSSGKKELTDINALADEYLRLAYHGIRAKDKSFQSDFKTDFDATLPKIGVVSQDMGRVFLNLINNAFQATSDEALKRKLNSSENQDSYKPTVSIKTELTANGQLLITITDNGPGIPPEIKDKIFQPFFTTKETGKGTGLGLSLAYDIVKAHGGELKLESEENEGATFIIQFPK